MSLSPTKHALDKYEVLRRTGLAVSAMQERGLKVLVTGSLARGDFNEWSDVDFLVTECPDAWRHRIESVVEKALGHLAFDVIYLDRMTPARAALMQRDAKPLAELLA